MTPELLGGVAAMLFLLFVVLGIIHVIRKKNKAAYDLLVQPAKRPKWELWAAIGLVVVVAILMIVPVYFKWV